MTEIDISTYRQSARERQKAKQETVARRWEDAWAVARQAAALLKDQYGVSQVIIFGSLVQRPRFHTRSDVDLAVLGLDERVYYRVISRLLDIDSTIEVDLIRLEDAPDYLREAIEREGMILT